MLNKKTFTITSFNTLTTTPHLNIFIVRIAFQIYFFIDVIDYTHLHEILYEANLIIKYIYINYTRSKSITFTITITIIIIRLFKRFTLTKSLNFSFN